ERVFPTVVDWRTNAPKDGMPAESTYSIEAVRALDTHRTPIQKQPEMLLCVVEISRRYYLGDEVYPTFLHDDDRDMDLFNLIRAPNPTKVKIGSRPSAPHEAPLLTLTANRVIEMDDPAATTDSSGVPSTIERSLLDFAHEAGASDQGTAAPEMPLSEDVPATVAPGAGQAEEVAAADPPAAAESRKRGRDGIDVNAPPKVLSSQGTAAAGDPDSENAYSPLAVGSPKSGNGVTAALEIRTGGKAAEEVRCSGGSPGQKDSAPGARNKKPISITGGRDEYEESRGRQECWAKPRIGKYACPVLRSSAMEARLDALSIDFDEELYPHMLTAIAGRRWVIGRGLRLAVMKSGESLELRQAFADVVSAWIAKGLSEGLRHGLEHGQAQLSLESIEAYDPKAEAKFVAALQALKDLKYPLVDQLEGLKDAPMDVIMAALYLESDTGDDATQYIRDLHPSSSQLTILVYPEVRDPRTLGLVENKCVLYAPWESLLISNVLGIALRTQSPRPSGLQPVYAAYYVQRYTACNYSGIATEEK
nr:transposase (putative), gypsy type [Tanacetum cinerariifolium]